MNRKYIISFFVFTIAFLFVRSISVSSINNNISLGDTIKLGDVNSDGKINSQDYIIIRKSILKQTTLTGKQKIAADVNSDSVINAKDYILIRKKILNSTSSVVTPKPTAVPTPVVTPAPTVTIKLDKDNILLTVNAKETIKATTNSSERITWTSSNNGVATVDANGLVIAKAAGDTTITAKLSSSNKSVSSKVRVANIESFYQQNKGVEEYLKNSHYIETTHNQFCKNINCSKPLIYNPNMAGNINIYQYNESSHAKTFVATTTQGDLNYYLLPNILYYLESQSNSNSYKLVKFTGQVRMISDTIQNFRDLGGWQADGGTIKYGRIYRSATSDKLSEGTINALKLGKIVDLRDAVVANDNLYVNLLTKFLQL